MKLIIIACVIAVASSTDVIGGWSTGADDAESVATCPQGEVGVKCECKPVQYCDGEAFDHNGVTCRAYKQATHENVGAVRAHLTCERLTVIKSMPTRLDTYSAGPKATCDCGYALVSCAARTRWTPYKSYLTVTKTRDSCELPSTCRRCQVQAVCAKMR